MPAFRIGFGSDFSLVNQLVGVGTTAADYKLEVTNVLKGDFNITGVSTLTSYGGFTPQKQSGDDITITTSVATISEDIIVGLGKTFTVSVGSTAEVGTLENVSIGTHFSVPNGGIAARTEEPVEGMVRFNNDLNTLEFYNGVEWRQFTVTGASGRGVFTGGDLTPPTTKIMDYINISSTGNALSFGDLITAAQSRSAGSSEIRGLSLGGYNGSAGISDIDYITIASAGNGIDFGDLTAARWSTATASSSTRSVTSGGSNSLTTIDYVQISTLGNALNFGTLAQNFTEGAGCQSPTRGFFLKHANTPTTIRSVYITIASKGNGTSWDDLTISSDQAHFGCSNATRALVAGGDKNDGLHLKYIDYFTMATLAKAVYFGDLTVGRGYAGSTSSQIRGVFAGGALAPASATTNIIDYVTIASAGNAQDFGDLTASRRQIQAGLSDSHGGLGGF